MSINCLGMFEKNLRKLMETKEFKNTDFKTQMEIGIDLLRTGYGSQLFKTDTLSDINKQDKDENL